MAKTKKEIQEQNSEEKQDGITAGLTDSELYPDGSPPAGMTIWNWQVRLHWTRMPPRLTRIWAKLRMARHRIPRLRMMGMHPKMNRFSLVLNLVKATLVSQTETESSLEPDDVPQTEYKFSG